MKPKDVRLYNVLFPFWMLMLFPTVWLIVLPGNFLIDSLVLFIALRWLGIDEKKLWYKRHILKIFTFGMLSDLVGAAYMLLGVILYCAFSGELLPAAAVLGDAALGCAAGLLSGMLAGTLKR